MSWKSKVQRIHHQIKDICQILCGLVVAENYKRGQALIVDRTFKDNAVFFQDCFEVGRRHKIMNPDKMRAEYGKLIYMLMDRCLSVLTHPCRSSRLAVCGISATCVEVPCESL